MIRAVHPQSEDPVEVLLSALLREIPSYTRIPAATYRLQLRPSFGFREAAALVPYLDRLGVTAVYTSPVLKAGSGSTHGYDVVDHEVLNPELGGAEGYDALAAALAEREMGHVLDFVPNHMAIGSENALWMDVLENGPSSLYADFFDIDWHPVKEELAQRVLVPVLGDQYGAVLERGELVLELEAGGFFLRYFEHRFPVTPRQYTQILAYRLDELRAALPPGDEHLEELLSIITALSNLPSRSERDPARIEERHREKQVVKRRLMALIEASPPIREHIEGNLRLFNGRPGDPRSFDLLDGLLREQAYRLAYWRVAAEEINYRRFFDINSLAAIRMEDPRVMRRAHAKVLQLVTGRKVTGLRIDHPDGLYAPAQYFAGVQLEVAEAVARRIWERGLRESGALAEGEPVTQDLEQQWRELEPELRERIRAEAARGASSPLFRPLYLVAEKILVGSETIPPGWALHGTTGYDFLNAVNGLFVDARAEGAIDEVFTRFTGLKLDYAELVYQKRRAVMGESMSSEMNVLARQLNRISEHDRRSRDFTLNSLRRALVEVVACFPVYRTYLAPDDHGVDERDRQIIDFAVRRARARNLTLDASVFEFIRDLMLGQVPSYLSPEHQQERRQFALKLQQVTAPVMAKSVEDTVFYVYNRLVSLNEVGGDPSRFGMAPQAFHTWARERAARFPSAFAATSTHDTKRSEDVRLRIDALSEMPGEWKKRLSTWARLNRRHKVRVGEALAPDANEELLLYQTLLGVWPFEPVEGSRAAELTARVQAYLHKAIREAKVNTSWVSPNEEWERAVAGFVATVLDPARSERFLRDFIPFQARVARVGAFHSLSQLLLKLALPGVPDIYQGCELWDLSLVDPDNRRPVDFALRQRLLEEIDKGVARGREALAMELAAQLADGRVKLYVTSQGLRLRRQMPELFRSGEYLPLRVSGEAAENLVAAARRHGEERVTVLAPRLVGGLLERAPDLAGERAWRDTFIELPLDHPGERLIDLFTGRAIPVTDRGAPGIWARDTFTGFPVVLALPEPLAQKLPV